MYAARPPISDQGFQRRDDLIGVDAALHHYDERFAGELAHDVQ